MLILFTPEENKSTEKEQLIYFLENELSVLHVRKPRITELELRSWLSQFEEKYLRKMVLHQHHGLAEAFPVKGIHLKENIRRKQENLELYIEHYKLNGFTISSSFHDFENMKTEALLFDYVILSPVFTSVSKEGYQGKEFNVEKFPHKVVALGGIEADKIPRVKYLGYEGVAVMGAIWLAENKQQAFNEIYNKYRNVYK